MADTRAPKTQKRQYLNPLYSLSRMAIGGIVLGLDILSGKYLPPEQTEPTAPVDQTNGDQIFYEVLPESEDIPGTKLTIPTAAQKDEELTYILTGLLVDTSNRIGQTTRSINSASGRLSRTVVPWISPFLNNPATRPFRKGFDHLVDRGENQVERWRRIGQDEAKQGFDLMENLTISTIDTSVDYIVQQPPVVRLATSKTRSIGSMILEYLRAIFVSLDVFGHGLFRRILRLPQVAPIQPTDAVRKGATLRFLGVEKDTEGTYIGYNAGFFNRISALVIDLFILGITLQIGLWFIITSAQFLRIELQTITVFGYQLSNFLTFSIIAVACFWIYNTLSWTLFGNTVGQALLGIRVLTTGGEIPGVVRSFLRVSLGISLSITFFILTFLMMFLDRRHRAPHDHLFRTIVVYTWDAHPSERFMQKVIDKYEPDLGNN